MEFEQINKTVNFKVFEVSSVDDELIEDFSCGNEQLDATLKKMKFNNEATTYVFLDAAKRQIIAYCTFTASGLTKSYENDLITCPAAEIKYFATDERYQHIQYGELDPTYKISDHVLCKMIEHLEQISRNTIYFDYIILYSVPDAKTFYERNGFETFDEYMSKDSYKYIEDCIPMYMKI